MTLQQAGGVDYLLRQAEAEPKAFLSLVGRILPLEVSGPNACKRLPVRYYYRDVSSLRWGVHIGRVRPHRDDDSFRR